MAVTGRRTFSRIGAQYRVSGRWYRDLNHQSKPGGKRFRCWVSIVSVSCQEQSNWAINLIQKIRQRGRIADVISGENPRRRFRR